MSSRNGTYYLNIDLQFGEKSVTLSIPPVLLALLLLFGMASYKVAHLNAVSTTQQQKERIAELQVEKQQLEETIAHKEKERIQMASLAEARSEELWKELESRDREINRLWHVVGQKPGQSVARGEKPRSSLLSSRSGRQRSALAVKVDYSRLETQVETRGLEIQELAVAARAYQQKKLEEYRRDLANRTPSITPCEGEMTSDFGNRIHPVYGYGRFHGGCDFTAPHGTPIRATAAGTVVHSDWMGGYGQVIEIDHGNDLKTLYAHCSELLVAKGTPVNKGQLIAKVGSTGLSSGPHCHYEVHQGEKQIDPKDFLKGVVASK
ncbi:MAG: peptidoglycan DD-metalloendopeptidase family protein [Vulcanimicrobiota bacterium]